MPDRDRITANEGLASAVALVTLVGLMALLRAALDLGGAPLRASVLASRG